MHAGTNLLADTFGYGASDGRLSIVSDGARSAQYSYLANTPLVEYIYHKNGGATNMTTHKQYDNVYRLTNIANTVSGTAVSSRGYEYNSANCAPPSRPRMIRTGPTGMMTSAS